MLEDLEKLLEKELIFQKIIDHYGLPIITTREQGFPSIVHLILEQQVSIASAQASYDKLKNNFGAILPSNLCNLSLEEFRSVGISKQKASYIVNLAEKILQKELNIESWNNLPEEQVYKELISLKGIGRWTAEVYLMFCLQKKDVFPVGDIAVQHTMRDFFETETKEEMEIYAEKWKPFRSLATYLLWHWYLGKRNRL
jgi:DNA-3-methyladenine glycosylase II